MCSLISLNRLRELLHITLFLAAWVQSLYKIVALDLLLVCALAKSVWEREAYPHQGVMATARRPD